MTLAHLAVVVLLVAAQDVPRAMLDRHYKEKSAAEMAAWFEQDSRPVYRYRTAIASLLQLEPGMTAAEVGAGSGFVARELVKQVGASGRVIAVEIEPKMVAWIDERAKAEGLANLSAVQGRVDSTALEPASVDGLLMVNTFSYLAEPDAILKSAAAVLKPSGSLVIVDFPFEGSGATRAGIDADEVIGMASAAGFERVSESSIVPGQYALRFRLRK